MARCRLDNVKGRYRIVAKVALAFAIACGYRYLSRQVRYCVDSTERGKDLVGGVAIGKIDLVEGKLRARRQLGGVDFGSGASQVIDRDYTGTQIEKSQAETGSDEAAASGDQDAPRSPGGLPPPGAGPGRHPSDPTGGRGAPGLP